MAEKKEEEVLEKESAEEEPYVSVIDSSTGVSSDEDETGDSETAETEDDAAEDSEDTARVDKKDSQADGSTPSIREIIKEVREELEGEKKKEEPKDSAGPKTYTHDELNSAEDRLDEMLDEGEITKSVYRQYMRNIQNIRDSMKEQELVLKIQEGRKKQTAEEMITGWAKQNAPEYLDGRTAQYRDAIEWAESTLGAEKRGDVWMLPAKVAAVAFGVLHKGQSGTKEGDERKKGYEEGVRDKAARAAELRSRDQKPPRPTDKTGEGPASKDEKKVMEELGLPPERLSTYRKLKSMSTNRAVVEVG